MWVIFNRFTHVTHLSTVNIAAIYLFDKSSIKSKFGLSYHIMILGTQTAVLSDNGYV